MGNRIDITRQTQTAETDTTKRLAPDGTGGVTWGTGGGGTVGIGTYGLLVEDGASSPPVTLYTEDGTDWLYADGP